MTKEPTMGLADAIAELRSELSKARAEGKGKDIRFATGEITVELAVDFGWQAEAEGGVSKWIPFVDLKAKGTAKRDTGHKITLNLTVDPEGDESPGLIMRTDGPKPVAPKEE